MWAHPERQAGMALMLVLWVLVLLSVIAGEFCYATRTEVNTARNFKQETEAYYIAQAGMVRAIQGLLLQELRTAAVVTEVKEAEEEGAEEAIEWRINAPIPAVPFGAGRFQVKIDNESGKVDLNSAGPDMLRMLLAAFDLEEHEKDVIVDSILDWRDEDDLHRLNGAEDDYYLGLDRPYPCKDGPFEAVEELLLVRGVTPEIFYGGLRDMVTLYRLAYEPAENAVFGTLARAKRKGGSGKVNINAASPDMLKALPGMTEELAAKVVEYRRERDIEASSELAGIVGPEAYAALSHYVTYRSNPFYTIRTVGEVDRVRRGIEALVRIDRRLKEGFRILSWTDALAHAEMARAPARGVEKES